MEGRKEVETKNARCRKGKGKKEKTSLSEIEIVCLSEASTGGRIQRETYSSPEGLKLFSMIKCSGKLTVVVIYSPGILVCFNKDNSSV